MAFVTNTDHDRALMLESLGLESTDQLFDDIPADVRFPALSLPPAQTEMEILARMRKLAGRNPRGSGSGGVNSFAGAGAYHHFIPSVVSHLAGRGEFATAYTPYQAEASQGTLQAIFEYQSMLGDLLDMEVVNASHYDGSTAVAEAALMAVRSVRGREKVVLSGSLHPYHIDVTRTYLEPQGIPMEIVDPPQSPGSSGPPTRALLDAITDETAAVIVSNPDFLGQLHDLTGFADAVHERGALFVLHIDPIATALLKSPGSLGADIVTGEGQPLGIPVSYGGPYLGIFAARQSLVRKLPGRLVGQTVDTKGQRGFVLTLNTREQHIRREKATSNICTNQGLMALRASIYLAAMGPEGLREAAERCYQNACFAATTLAELPGCSTGGSDDQPFFREFVLTTPVPAKELVERCSEAGIIPGVPLVDFYPGRTNDLLIAVTELATRADIDLLARTIGEALEADHE